MISSEGGSSHYSVHTKPDSGCTRAKKVLTSAAGETSLWSIPGRTTKMRFPAAMWLRFPFV